MMRNESSINIKRIRTEESRQKYLHVPEQYNSQENNNAENQYLPDGIIRNLVLLHAGLNVIIKNR
jgi:hypothetical protein